jgi:hypothetical protein
MSLIDLLVHPLTGRYLYKPTMSYWYILGGIKMAECSLRDLGEKEQRVIDKEIWGMIFEECGLK